MQTRLRRKSRDKSSDPWNIKMSYTKNFGYTPLIRLHRGDRFGRDLDQYHTIDRTFEYNDIYKLVRRSIVKAGYEHGHDYNDEWLEDCTQVLLDYLNDNGRFSFDIFVIDRIVAAQKLNTYVKTGKFHFFMPPKITRGGINSGKLYSSALFNGNF